MSKIRLVIEMEIIEDQKELYDISNDEILENMTIHDYPVGDGCEIYTSISRLQDEDDYVLTNCKIINKEII